MRLRPQPGQALVAVLAALMVASWFPFRPGFEGPYFERNGASWRQDGALVVTERSVVRDVPDDWLQDARGAESLRLELHLRSHAKEQRGPARILAISKDSRHANLVIGQEGDALVLRCRRPGSGEDGEPRLEAPAIFDDAHFDSSAVCKVVVELGHGVLTLAVDGIEQDRELVGARPFEGWSPAYRVNFGNEESHLRPWRGEVLFAVATVSNETIDLLDRDVVEVPRRFLHIPKRAREVLALDHDVVAFTFLWHVGIFTPLGFCLAAWLGTRRGYGHRLFLLGTATLSVTLELGKLGFERRHPSLLHLAPDLLGACLGAWLLHLVRARTRSARVPASL